MGRILVSNVPMGWLNEPELTSDLWSGMVDQDGKEFYENDFVSNGDRNGQVVFHAGSFVIDFEDVEIPLFGNHDKFKVIGNIFELLSQSEVDLIEPESRERYYCCFDCDGESWWDENEEEDLTPYDWRIDILTSLIGVVGDFVTIDELKKFTPYINKSVWELYNQE